MTHIERIHAISTPPVFSIAAAKQSPDYRAVSGLLAKAGIEIDSRIALFDLDQKLAAAPRQLTTTERIALKSALGRAGILP